MTKKNHIVDCPDAEAIAAFKHNISDEWLARELGQEKPRTMAALTQLMTQFCVGEDNWLAWRSGRSGDPSTSKVRDGNGKPRRNRNNKHRNRGSSSDAEETTVNVGFSNQRGGNKSKPFQGGKDGPTQLDKILDKPCAIQSTPDKPAMHTNRKCSVIKQAGKIAADNHGKGQPRNKDRDQPGPGNVKGRGCRLEAG